jgi:hypothetical protein
VLAPVPLQPVQHAFDEPRAYQLPKTEAENMLATKFYPVDDLVVDRHGQSEGYAALIELIMSTIKPASWDDTGGPGTVDGFELNGIHALVVTQIREVHEEITSLLDALRRLRAKGRDNRKLEHAVPAQASRPKAPRHRHRTYAEAPIWSAPWTHE